MAGGRLQREIKKRRPFDSLEQKAILDLYCTSDQIQICFTRLFRRHGLTPSQYNILLQHLAHPPRRGQASVDPGDRQPDDRRRAGDHGV